MGLITLGWIAKLDWITVAWGMILAGIIFQMAVAVYLISADGAQAGDYITAGVLFAIATINCVILAHIAFAPPSCNCEKAQKPIADFSDS